MAKNYQVREVQLRNANVEENDGKMILEGYAVVFDSPTVLETDSVGNEYKEVISRNVFDDADMSDCCLKYNHGGLLLARVRGGSLKLTVDDYGLKFRAELFNTQLSRDVYEIVKQGGLDRCSFSFTVKEKKYDKAIELYKLLINHAGGNDKKLYIAEGFFNLGLMENFGYGIPKNLSKSKNFFDKAEKYESNCYYPVWIVRLINKFFEIFGKGDKYYNSIKNETIVVNKNITKGFGKIQLFLEKINLLSVALFFFLIFYGWFFFNIKFQGSDTDN